jgi:hypothetical protein
VASVYSVDEETLLLFHISLKVAADKNDNCTCIDDQDVYIGNLLNILSLPNIIFSLTSFVFMQFNPKLNNPIYIEINYNDNNKTGILPELFFMIP